MMQHQSPEYDSVPTESITLVSRLKWWLVQAAFVLTIVGGCALLIILDDIGLDTLKRQIGLAEAFQTDDSFARYAETRDTELRLAGQTTFIAPFILEASAINYGVEDSAWGIWVQTTDNQEWLFLINNGGYVSISDSREPDWIEFIHVLPREENSIYLHFGDDYHDSPYPWNDERTLQIPSTVTLRVNNEIAWTGELPPRIAGWGIVRFRNPDLEWAKIQLYGKWAETDSIQITPSE